MSADLWLGITIGGAVSAMATFGGQMVRRYRERKGRHGMPACWSCNGTGFHFRVVQERAHAKKCTCPVCNGQGWTEQPAIAITPGRAGKPE